MTAPRARESLVGVGASPLGRPLRQFALPSGVSPLSRPRMDARERNQVPFLHRRHVRRPRLARVLDTCSAQSIILVGPAGYGKTSLAAEWLAERENVAWYRATSASADVAAFSAGLCETIVPIVPGAGERVLQRLRIADSPESAARPLAELLAEDLTDWPDGGWLVIDDYQFVVTSKPVEEFMDWLLMLSPRLRVLVTSRRRPGWATARRILYGEVAEFAAEHLAMTTDEAAEVLDARAPSSVGALVAQAEGWPAVIGLAALSSNEVVPSERVADELFRFVADEVFREQPSEVQQFMLAASIPPTFRASDYDVYDDLVSEPDLALETLADEGLIAELHPGEFRFHPLLQDFLRRHLVASSPETAQEVTSRFLRLARANRRWAEAFELAQRSGRLDEGAAIIGDAAADLLAAGQVETLERWLDMCGTEVFRVPSALLTHAEILTRRGRLADASSIALKVARSTDATASEASRAWSLAGKAKHLLSDDQHALQHHERALEFASTDAERAECLWGAFVCATDLERPEAASLLKALSDVAPGDIDLEIRTADGRALLGWRTGDLREAISSMEATVPLLQYATDPLVKMGFMFSNAYVNCLRGRYRDALSLLTRVDKMFSVLRLSYADAYGQAVRVLGLIGLRRFRDARQEIERLRRLAASIEDPWLDASITILRIKLELSRSGRANFSHRARLRDEARISSAMRGELLAIEALAHAVDGDVENAVSKAVLAREMTRGIEALFISRYAELAAGQMGASEAARLFRETLEHSMIDAALLGLRTSRSLRENLVQLPGTRDFVQEIIQEAGDNELAATLGLASPNPDGLTGGLTPRERDVLRLMSAGLSNRAIAKQLVVEESTVKAHVHNLLNKLGVTNRLEAVLAVQDEAL